MLAFEWDENKNQANRQKHKISFESAQYIFLDPNAKQKFDRDEDRRHIIGKVLNIVVVLVVYTERNGKIRIISARRANKKERILYHGSE
jgi:uncharacterized DUF497 family protein